jgi:hypothetical protein
VAQVVRLNAPCADVDLLRIFDAMAIRFDDLTAFADGAQFAETSRAAASDALRLIAAVAVLVSRKLVRREDALRHAGCLAWRFDSTLHVATKNCDSTDKAAVVDLSVAVHAHLAAWGLQGAVPRLVCELFDAEADEQRASIPALFDDSAHRCHVTAWAWRQLGGAAEVWAAVAREVAWRESPVCWRVLCFAVASGAASGAAGGNEAWKVARALMHRASDAKSTKECCDFAALLCVCGAGADDEALWQLWELALCFAPPASSEHEPLRLDDFGGAVARVFVTVAKSRAVGVRRRRIVREFATNRGTFTTMQTNDDT